GTYLRLPQEGLRLFQPVTAQQRSELPRRLADGAGMFGIALAYPGLTPRRRDQPRIATVIAEIDAERRRRGFFLAPLLAHRKAIDLLGAGMVSILLHPGREFGEGADIGGGMQIALVQHVAEQQAILQPLDLAGGCRPVSLRLGRENPLITLGILG